MRLTKIIIFFNLLTFVASKLEEISSDEFSLYNKPIHSIILSLFIPYGYVNTRVFIASSKNAKSMDIANELLQLTSDVKFMVKTLDEGTVYKERRVTPIIFLFESLKEFENVKKVLAIDNAKFYLVILQKGILEGIEEVLKYFWKNSATNVNFLVKDGSNFSMLTYFPFRNGRCGEKLELTKINSFDSKTENWISNELYPSKVKDLQGCTFKVGVSLNTPFSMLENETFYGIDIDIMEEIGKRLNFTNHFNGPYASIGVVFANGSSTGLLGSLWNYKNDFGIGLLSLQYERIIYLPASSFYITAVVTLTMPPTLRVTPLEKLYLPYDTTIWTFFLLFYVCGVLTILISKIISKNAYEFIIGKKVNHAILNMLIAIYGGSQKVLPPGNFARFLLAQYLLFTLVMRALYQGKLFDLMQKDLHYPEPKTIEELVQKDFDFYTFDTLARRIQDKRIVKRVKSISLAQLEEYRHKTLDPNFKGVIMSYDGQVAYFNSQSYKSYVYLICNERYLNNPMVFYYQPRHFMIDKINEKIDYFREFGIISYLTGRYIDLKFLITPPPEAKTGPLTYDHDLSGIFIIWIGGLVASTIAWVIEVLLHSIVRKFRRGINRSKK